MKIAKITARHCQSRTEQPCASRRFPLTPPSKGQSGETRNAREPSCQTEADHRDGDHRQRDAGDKRFLGLARDPCVVTGPFDGDISRCEQDSAVEKRCHRRGDLGAVESR